MTLSESQFEAETVDLADAFNPDESTAQDADFDPLAQFILEENLSEDENEEVPIKK